MEGIKDMRSAQAQAEEHMLEAAQLIDAMLRKLSMTRGIQMGACLCVAARAAVDAGVTEQHFLNAARAAYRNAP